MLTDELNQLNTERARLQNPDPLETLSPDQIKRAELLKSFVSEDIQNLSLSELNARLATALRDKDKALLFLYQRGAAPRRELEAQQNIKLKQQWGGNLPHDRRRELDEFERLQAAALDYLTPPGQAAKLAALDEKTEQLKQRHLADFQQALDGAGPLVRF